MHVFQNFHGDFLSHSCGRGETGQVFGTKLPFLFGIDKYGACFISTGTWPDFYAVQFVKRKYQNRWTRGIRT